MPGCPSLEDGWTGHVPEGCAIPLWGPGSGDGSGPQGDGAGRKEEEAAQGGRATVAMEGAARYSGIRILTAEDWGWGERVVGEGDGEASVFLLSLARSCIPTDRVVPSHPRSRPPAVPSLSGLSASCTEGRVAPSRRPVYQHNSSKLVLLKGIQPLSLQTSSPQRGPVMPSPWNLLKWGLLCILIDFLPPTTLNAFNLLLQMANFENPLIRIRSSASIFIYFSFL